ncbi:shikimate dehydrogenase [Oleidesulfovibrio sp.]|uniref:shikimate dehydrogenase n=1 Tax=Oleidesulfovibrio sp. TaxID=2909707 RepID=UPI003A8B706A
MTTPRIPAKLYGIIGHPLGHTMSPLLHNWGFELLKEDAAYMAFPVTPEALPEFIRSVRTLPVSGLSVTIPHKQAIMPLLDSITPRAQTAGAVNTVFWHDGKLTGDNTDVTGFLQPLLPMKGRFTHALVLGAGGAANAVLTGLAELGVPLVTISNRNEERALSLAKRFRIASLPWEERHVETADLIINTTPLGMSGESVHNSPVTDDFFASTLAHAVAYDLVYNPLETRFLAQAKHAGRSTIDGLSMFVAQGAEQFRIWRGKELPFDEARALIAAMLGL